MSFRHCSNTDRVCFGLAATPGPTRQDFCSAMVTGSSRPDWCRFCGVRKTKAAELRFMLFFGRVELAHPHGSEGLHRLPLLSTLCPTKVLRRSLCRRLLLATTSPLSWQAECSTRLHPVCHSTMALPLHATI